MARVLSSRIVKAPGTSLCTVARIRQQPGRRRLGRCPVARKHPPNPTRKRAFDGRPEHPPPIASTLMPEGRTSPARSEVPALEDPFSHSKAGAAMASPAASFVSYREPTHPLVNNDLGSPTRLFQGTDQALASAIIASKPTRAVNKRCSELNYRATLSNRSLPPNSCRSRRQPEAEALRHLKRSVASTDDVSLSGPRVKA